MKIGRIEVPRATRAGNDQPVLWFGRTILVALQRRRSRGATSLVATSLEPVARQSSPGSVPPSTKYGYSHRNVRATVACV